jgi:hypothetical protein
VLPAVSVTIRQRGRSDNDWAEALLQQCQEAELEVVVPSDVPVHVCRLYKTLGIIVRVDPRLPSWRPVRSGSAGKVPR